MHVMVEACQVNIARLLLVTPFKRSASLHRSVAVSLQSAKNNLWFNLWAGCPPSLPESFRVLAFPVLLQRAGGVRRVGGVVSGLGGNKCHNADSDLLCRDLGPRGQAPDQADDSADLEIHLCLSDPRRIKRRDKPFLALKGCGMIMY